MAAEERISYNQNGQICCKGLIPNHLISECLNAYQDAIELGPLVYTQSTHKWKNLEVDEYGLGIDSLLNPSTLKSIYPLSSNIQKIIYHENIYLKLLELIGSPESKEIACWQDMLFDRSTATVPHVDSWYLDVPQGQSNLSLVCPRRHQRREWGILYIFKITFK